MLSNYTGYTEWNDRIIVDYEIEGMWKEVFVAYFKALTQHSHKGAEENH
jgi:hypothetical protein